VTEIPAFPTPNLNDPGEILAVLSSQMSQDRQVAVRDISLSEEILACKEVRQGMLARVRRTDVTVA
jgi:hypothetical protein